ncbi:MAG: hypothetical protein ACRDOI_37110 [Trebonia sp.]
MTTPAINKSACRIRALLTDDIDTFRRLNAGRGGDETRAFATMLAAAFYTAANDKFGKDHTTADVIEFVAEARAWYIGPETVSAEDAERVIRAVLGEEDLTNGMSAYALGAAQTVMLVAIVRVAGFSPAKMDALLDVAARRVRSYFERQGRR